MHHPKARTYTEVEKLGVSAPLNLADAHPRQPLTASQQHIIDALPKIYERSMVTPEQEIETRLIRSLFALARQPAALLNGRCFLSYAASCSIDIVASWCGRTCRPVGLIEPCFDNIPGLLKQHQAPFVAVPESILYEAPESVVGSNPRFTVLWIVVPNNPTGAVISEASLDRLSSFCAKRGIVLVADLCFRLFSERMLAFDQYDVLRKNKCEYIAIEDTGKTWPLMDVKCGLLLCSNDLYQPMYDAHDNLLLGLSPFAMTLMTEFIEDSLRQGLVASVRAIPYKNRDRILTALNSMTDARLANQDSELPLMWIGLPTHVPGREVFEECKSRGLFILPGENFFWHNPSQGAHQIRISPLRKPQIIEAAIPILIDAIKSLETSHS